jgi:hypothetical protein
MKWNWFIFSNAKLEKGKANAVEREGEEIREGNLDKNKGRAQNPVS